MPEGEPHRCTQVSSRWCQEDWAKLFSVVPSMRTHGNGHKLKHSKFHLNSTKTFFLYFEGYRELEEAAWNGCGVSSRITPNPPQHKPVQSALGKPVLAGGLNWMLSRGPFQPQPFHYSVKAFKTAWKAF